MSLSISIYQNPIMYIYANILLHMILQIPEFLIAPILHKLSRLTKNDIKYK